MIQFRISETFSFSDFRNVLGHISLPAAGSTVFKRIAAAAS